MVLTSALPMTSFESPKWTFTVLRDFAQAANASAVHLVNYSHARVTLQDKTVREAVWSLTSHSWIWADMKKKGTARGR